jgi:ribonuclease P protein component
MEACCFPRAARLRKAAEFAALRGGTRIACRHFHAEYRFSSLDTARLGLVVSRRVSKLAVERNRLKRLARESFRRWRPALPFLDLALIARPSAVPVDGNELLADLEGLWRRLAALKPSGAPGTIRP